MLRREIDVDLKLIYKVTHSGFCIGYNSWTKPNQIKRLVLSPKIEHQDCASLTVIQNVARTVKLKTITYF